MSGLAQARRSLDDRVEHRLQVDRRAADDAEHLAGRSLVFERLLQLALARLLLLEQPRVLDGDDGLVGERGGECDLGGCKRLGSLSDEFDDPDRLIVAHERD